MTTTFVYQDISRDDEPIIFLYEGEPAMSEANKALLAECNIDYDTDSSVKCTVYNTP